MPRKIAQHEGRQNRHGDDDGDAFTGQSGRGAEIALGNRRSTPAASRKNRLRRSGIIFGAAAVRASTVN